MIKRTLLFAMIAPMALGACSRSAELRYRVSYTVDDNGVSRSASGVWSDTIRPALIPLATKFESEFHGEAIPLRLPGRGVLLLTPLGDRTGGIYASTAVRHMFAYKTSADSSDLVAQKRQMSNLVGASKPLRCERYAIPQPPLKPNELATEQCLDFMFLIDPNKQSTFGRISVADGYFTGLKGVRLKDARVTISRAPVSVGRLVTLLPWLPAAQAYWTKRLRSDRDDKFLAEEIIYMKQ